LRHRKESEKVKFNVRRKKMRGEGWVAIREPGCQLRETKADTLKATEANRRWGPGTREKVRSRRINLEDNTHAQEINVSQCPV
jgi:hypothetical protein